MNISAIDKLIIKCCPDGVEYRMLGNIITIQTGKLNANAMVKNGKYPFFTCDFVPYRIDTYAFDTEAILISGNGSQVGHINYYKGKFNVYQRTYVLSDIISDINIFFFLHYLRSHLKGYILQNCKKGSVPYITLPMLVNFKVPVPPMPVQEEIVRILDTYSELEAELEAKLEAELDARKKQYEYYLNQLLSFDENDKDVKFMQLGEIGTFIKGNGLQKKDFTDSGVGCIHYGQIYTYYGTYTQQTKSFVSDELAKKLKKAQKGDLIIATTSENVEDVGKAVAWLGNESICIGGHSTVFHHNQNPKYMAYLFQTEIFFKQKQKVAKGVKVIDISDKAMSKFKFGFPSIEEQERIVSILDEFNKLTNEISDSLQAEITARKKQYEYYRNKLLTFKEAV